MLEMNFIPNFDSVKLFSQRICVQYGIMIKQGSFIIELALQKVWKFRVWTYIEYLWTWDFDFKLGLLLVYFKFSHPYFELFKYTLCLSFKKVQIAEYKFGRVWDFGGKTREVDIDTYITINSTFKSHCAKNLWIANMYLLHTACKYCRRRAKNKLNDECISRLQFFIDAYYSFCDMNIECVRNTVS